MLNINDLTGFISLQCVSHSPPYFRKWCSHLSPSLNPIYQIVEAKDKHHNPSHRHRWLSQGSLPWSRSCFECLYRGPSNLHQHDSIIGSQTFKMSLIFDLFKPKYYRIFCHNVYNHFIISLIILQESTVSNNGGHALLYWQQCEKKMTVFHVWRDLLHDTACLDNPWWLQEVKVEREVSSKTLR